MPFDRFVSRWVGVALVLISVVASIWLTVTGKLTLYIHPRYKVFTVAMALLAGALAVAAIAVPRSRDEHDGHDEHEELPANRRWARALSAGRLGVVLVTAAALLLIPPATLSASTSLNRGLITSGHGLDGNTTQLAGGNPATFTVKDWAVLLRQGGPDEVLGKNANITGYVVDQADPDVFYLVRLVISCCAVDAQPVGVPVYKPGWRGEFTPGTWLSLKGSFIDNPDRESKFPVVIKIGSLTRIAEPDQPYVF